jgi:hypothetical protein
VFDDESNSCMACDRLFTAFMRRRHHCRQCGILVCSPCSTSRLPVKGLAPGTHRVCDDCNEAALVTLSFLADVLRLIDLFKFISQSSLLPVRGGGVCLLLKLSENACPERVCCHPRHVRAPGSRPPATSLSARTEAPVETQQSREEPCDSHRTACQS